jgi:hypothetical protein
MVKLHGGRLHVALIRFLITTNPQPTATRALDRCCLSCMTYKGFQLKSEFETAVKAKAELSEVARQVSVIHAVISTDESDFSVADDHVQPVEKDEIG